MKSFSLFRVVFIIFIGMIALVPKSQTHSQTTTLGSAWDVVWNPDGTLLAVSGTFGIALYDADFELDQVITRVTTSRLAWSPDGNFLATSSGSPSVYNFTLWDIPNMRRVARIDLQTYVVALSWSPDSQRLAVATSDQGIFVYDLDPANFVPHLAYTLTSAVNINDAAWSPDGKYIAAVEGGIQSNVILYVWNTETDTEDLKYSVDVSVEAQMLDASLIAWSPDSTQITIGGVGGYRIGSLPNLDVTSQTFSMGYWEPTGYIQFLEWSPDGSRLAATDRSYSGSGLYLFDTVNHDKLWSKNVSSHDTYYGGMWKPDSSQLAMLIRKSFGDGDFPITVHILNARNGAEVAKLGLPDAAP